jgi:quinol monooxygenase YgiN
MAKPGMRDQYAAALQGTIDITHGEDGCEQYELCYSQEDANKLVLLERWTSPELLEKHMEAMRARGPMAGADFRAEGGASFERYEV